jgi:single-stranded DNA-binding protein
MGKRYEDRDDLNQVTFTGSLVSDPQRATFGRGNATEAVVAIRRKNYRVGPGEPAMIEHKIPIVVYGEAGNVLLGLTAGSRILVSGILTGREYQGKSYLGLQVRDFEVIGRLDGATTGVPVPPHDAPRRESSAGGEDDLPF